MNVRQVFFKSKDGLVITADFYTTSEPKGSILLCHRSHYNRGEYAEIAPKLNALGFSCLAIDQRSGMNVLGFINETSTLAKQKGLATGYLDARQDIEAAVDYLYAYNANNKPIILMGSSYSASLALLIGKDSAKVKAVVAFSPGEYLKKVNLAESLAGFAKPVFVTSAKKEISDASAVVSHIDPIYVTQFKPASDGYHGARALWQSIEGNEAYWQALESFLLNQ